jgi:hypothetical protein
MPIYSFENPETGEAYDLTMSYDDLDQYLKDHPEVHQVFRMNIVDPVGIGITKPPTDFIKNVVGKVKAAAPGSRTEALEKRWSIPKEI